MTDSITGVRFRPLHFPDALDSPDAADFIAMATVRNAVYAHISGHHDHDMQPEALLPHYRPSAYERRLTWLVESDGRLVGRVGVDLPDEGESTLAFVLIELLPDVWGRGIGTSALELAERVARENGRTIIQGWAEHPDVPGARIYAPTGFGSVPAEDPGVRFAVRHGFSLEQIERNSAFDLRGSFEGVDMLLSQARAASTSYRVVKWFAPTPAEFVDGYAWMKSRMVTDAPSADMQFDEEKWDAARVAEHDARLTSSGATLHVVAAQHIETGELCAFNELAVEADKSRASHQEDTLVLKEHRGHKLGLLVKCENLRAWRDIAPDSPRVLTYNAEENRPMLDINEAIGFAPIAYEGAWKKVLD